MDKILGYLATMTYIFLSWQPIVVLVAAILFVNINGTELYYRLSCCLVDSYSRFVHRLAR